MANRYRRASDVAVAAARLLATIGVMAACLLPLPSVRAQGLEYELKARFLYYFAELVEWPAAAFTGPADPFQICVAGPDPFGPLLDRTGDTKAVGTHPIEVTRLTAKSRGDACHVLFVSRPFTRRTPALIARYRFALAVGESPDFLDQGGVINFVPEGARVRFDIDLGAASARRLELGSQLLRVARQVFDQPRSAGEY